MLQLDYIFIHCSDSEKMTKKMCDTWHQKRKFDECGYHFIVQPDGAIEVARSLNKVGAAVFGMNKNSIQICMVGKDSFSEDQMISTLKLVSGLARQHGIHLYNVLGHYEVDANKTCPNIEMKLFRASLQAMREIQQFIKTDFSELSRPQSKH